MCELLLRALSFLREKVSQRKQFDAEQVAQLSTCALQRNEQSQQKRG